MMKKRIANPLSIAPHRAAAAVVAALLGLQVGCTREFFREWANQDVSEAVFEKSRDPRWRLDIFSVEPPALSRFADPYDQDVPPAPPDDPAAEALSPVPQWPDNRLMVPVEGTGYLDLLEYWERQNDMRRDAENPGSVPSGYPGGPTTPSAAPRPSQTASPFAAPSGIPPVTPPAIMPAAPMNPAPTIPPPPPPPPAGQPGGAATPPSNIQASASPSGTRGIPAPNTEILRLQSPSTDADSSPPISGFARSARKAGTMSQGSTPYNVGSTKLVAASSTIPPPASADRFQLRRTQAPSSLKDRSVAPAAYQNPQPPAQPRPTPPPVAPAEPPPTGNQLPSEKPYLRPPVEDEQRRPGGLDPNIQNPPALPPGLLNEVGRMPAAEATGLATILVPRVPSIDEAEAMGLPRGYRAFHLGMQEAWLLALMNARFYQFNLEQVYLSALGVTLQRFAFEPQFYAGMGNGAVTTTSGGAASSPGVSGANSYTYATRYSPGGAASQMNLGTVAGVGKLFTSGGQLLMGFANELVFNFAGRNPSQPTVLSALPISFVQPLLAGGGRAVTMEPLTSAERALLYQVREFAFFRQQFIVVTLTGGTVQNFGNTFPLAGFSVPGNSDPTIGFIPAVINIAQVEIARKNVAFYENLVQLYNELIQGEASGLSNLQVDQVTNSLIGARFILFNFKYTYRIQLDQFKIQLGMPPDTPIVIDQHMVQPFYTVFSAVDNWQRNPNRTLTELPDIIKQLPELEDIDVEGRSLLGLYRNYEANRKTYVPEDEDPLEDQLQAAVRIALEYRLDLMNARAQLYDAWRQIRVTANALKGVLNLALTNNVYTPTGGTDPLGFLSAARQFSLTINAELPLVRVNQRNNFRTALINYQRQRRALQEAEDNLKYQLRFDLRNVHLTYIQYEINKRIYELNVRLKDQSFEQIVAPPAGGTQALAQSANAATQTTNLLNFQSQAYTSQQNLVAAYQAYEQNRLIVYRDIGTLPYDEWEAFSELFPTEYHGPILGQFSDGGPQEFTPPTTGQPAPGARR